MATSPQANLDNEGKLHLIERWGMSYCGVILVGVNNIPNRPTCPVCIATVKGPPARQPARRTPRPDAI